MVGPQQLQKLDFPEFVEQHEVFIQKLMEVAHVLVGMTLPGSLVYGILERGVHFSFGKNNDFRASPQYFQMLTNVDFSVQVC